MLQNLNLKYKNGKVSFNNCRDACHDALGMSQETTESFKPYGKPFARVFSNMNTSSQMESLFRAFEITRAYLGDEYLL
jgi:hypothetical protein